LSKRSSLLQRWRCSCKFLVLAPGSFYLPFILSFAICSELIVLVLFCGQPSHGPGLPDLSSYNIPKRGKIYQMTTKCNKMPLNLPICIKTYQIAIKYTNIFHYKTLQNLPKNGIFGLKTNHLATLTWTCF
jgi:hypothetical protein